MTATENSLRQVREATVKRHYEAENRHDLDAQLSTFSSAKASYDIPAFGEARQLRGAPAVREMWEGLLVFFPDIHHEVIRLRHGDDFVLVEYEVTGDATVRLGGDPRIGSSVQHPGRCRLRVPGRSARPAAGPAARRRCSSLISSAPRSP